MCEMCVFHGHGVFTFRFRVSVYTINESRTDAPITYNCEWKSYKFHISIYNDYCRMKKQECLLLGIPKAQVI